MARYTPLIARCSRRHITLLPRLLVDVDWKTGTYGYYICDRCLRMKKASRVQVL